MRAFLIIGLLALLLPSHLHAQTQENPEQVRQRLELTLDSLASTPGVLTKKVKRFGNRRVRITGTTTYGGKTVWFRQVKKQYKGGTTKDVLKLYASSTRKILHMTRFNGEVFYAQRVEYEYGTMNRKETILRGGTVTVEERKGSRSWDRVIFWK